MKLTKSKLKEMIREEIGKLHEKKEHTIALARAYHVAMDQKDYNELGKRVDRKYFKKYFHIPKDADEDRNYKRDPKFNIKKLTRIREEILKERSSDPFFKKINNTLKKTDILRYSDAIKPLGKLGFKILQHKKNRYLQMGKGSYWIEANPKGESMIMYGNSDTGDYFEFKYKKRPDLDY